MTLTIVATHSHASGDVIDIDLQNVYAGRFRESCPQFPVPPFPHSLGTQSKQAFTLLFIGVTWDSGRTVQRSSHCVFLYSLEQRQKSENCSASAKLDRTPLWHWAGLRKIKLCNYFPCHSPFLAYELGNAQIFRIPSVHYQEKERANKGH